MSSNLVSVIIPIYNVEKYLNKCIDSVLNQTYKNLEIILVDDGSPDNCPKICDEYAKLDTRIKVIHKQNGGLSSARNFGLDVCTGDYITFLDSDDYLDEDFVETLLSTILLEKTSIVVSGVKNVDENYSEIKKVEFENTKYSHEDRLDFLFFSRSFVSVIACGKLFSKEIFNELRFKEGVHHEDEYIAFDLYNNALNGVYVLSGAKYNYLQRVGGITKNKVVTRKVFDAIDAFKTRLSKIDKNSKYYNKAVCDYISSYIFVYKRAITNKEIRKEVYNLYKQALKQYKDVSFSFKHKIKFIAFKIAPKFYCWIYDLIRGK